MRCVAERDSLLKKSIILWIMIIALIYVYIFYLYIFFLSLCIYIYIYIMNVENILSVMLMRTEGGTTKQNKEAASHLNNALTDNVDLDG